MLNKNSRLNLLCWSCRLCLLLLIHLLSPALRAGEIQLPTLKIGTDVFTNVTVYQITATDIFHRHSRGFGNAKINTLDDDTLISLGLKEKTPEKPAAESPLSPVQARAAVEQVKTALATVNLSIPAEQIEMVKGQIARITADRQLLYGTLGGLASGYLIFCFCLRRVCVNAGSKPGLLIWLPILWFFPMLRAAKMPIWWFIVFLLFPLSILAHLLWCARIARACGKGFLSAFMLFLPVTNVLALLYLAFSGGGERPMGKPFRHEDLPGLAGA